MRTHYCGEIDEPLVGEEVEVAAGSTGGATTAASSSSICAIAKVCCRSFSIPIARRSSPTRSASAANTSSPSTGKVRPRPEGTVNPNMRTGEVEVLATDLDGAESNAETPPFHHDEQAHEDIRLRYRYLDLRRENMAGNAHACGTRSRKALRDFMDANGFVDIETPMLTRATPEGARDYIVPSRTHPGVSSRCRSRRSCSSSC